MLNLVLPAAAAAGLRRFLMVGVGLLALAPGHAAEPLDSIVAVVNDQVIVRSELDARIRDIVVQLAQRGTRLPPREIVERQVLEQLIQRKVQLQAAERLGVKVDDTTLAKAIGRIAERNNMDLLQMADVLEKDGMSFDRFREDTREQIILERLKERQVRSKVVVTDQEIRQFMKNKARQLSQRSAVNLSHILVATPDGASADAIDRARQRIAEIQRRLQQGDDFAELAVTYSDDRNALNGGEIGWLKMGEVPDLALEAAQTLEVGAVSDPIRSSSGFHLLRLNDFRGESGAVVRQTSARHILIRTNEVVSDQDAETRLRQLKFRADNGEDFAALARSHSEDTASAIKGGDLGWVNPGDMVPAFEKEMDKLAAGSISEPFRTQFGWHLLQVLERRAHDNAADLQRQKAREMLVEKKTAEATQLWLRRLRDEAFVETYLRTEGGY
jgi:peptidyl-prolyl cis-trans isomerase SurA